MTDGVIVIQYWLVGGLGGFIGLCTNILQISFVTLDARVDQVSRSQSDKP